MRRFCKDTRGATLLEFAFSSTIFFLTLLGILDFGQSIWRYNMMADLAQEGARWASVHASASSSPASQDDVVAYVRSRAPGVTVNVTTTTVNSSTRVCTSTTVAPSALSSGDGVCVRVAASWSRASTLLPVVSMALQGQAQMVVAR